MRNLPILLLVLLAMSGCATTKSPYGNFAAGAGAESQKIALDASQQIVALYPPAKTSLELQQPTPDLFGRTLIADLRKQGYEIHEYTVPIKNAPRSTVLPLRYVVDQPGESNLYRVTIFIGSQSLTRPYLKQNGDVVPAGYWARKEN